MANNIDLSKKILSENYEPQLKDFIPEFFSDRTRELDIVKNNQNLLEIAKIAHAWKGYSGPYGFDYLGELGAKIETESLAGNEEAVESLLSTVTEYLALKKTQFHLDQK